MRTSLKFRLGKAFTLIELLIVITIIGILAVALVPRISQGPAKARDVTRKADIGSISTALEFYFSDNSAYPLSSGTECISTTTSTTSTTSTANAANAAIAPFMKGSVVPTDPTNNVTTPCTTGGYGYKAFSATSYVVAALLETTNASGDNIYCSDPILNTNVTNATTLADELCATNAAAGDRFYALWQ